MVDSLLREALVQRKIESLTSRPSPPAGLLTSFTVRGGTDNKAAESLAAKGLSTKFPLMIVLMEYLAMCEQKRLRCQLDWRPRESNIEADDLTNQVFDKFDLGKRVEVSWSSLKFPMINLLMKFTESFSKRKFDTAAPSVTGPLPKFSKSMWG